MKLIYRSRTGSYSIDKETNEFSTSVPNKCKECNSIDKASKGCDLSECKKEEV
jgi:hypothetical protein